VGEGAACLHLVNVSSWMFQYPSLFEHGGSPYSGPLPGSDKTTRNITGLHEIFCLILFLFSIVFVCYVGFLCSIF